MAEYDENFGRKEDNNVDVDILKDYTKYSEDVQKTLVEIQESTQNMSRQIFEKVRVIEEQMKKIEDQIKEHMNAMKIEIEELEKLENEGLLDKPKVESDVQKETANDL